MSSVRSETPPGGARRAAPRPRPMNPTAVLAVLLVGLATALVLLVPDDVEPGTGLPPAAAPVEQLLLGCPGGTPDTGGRPRVQVGSAPVPGTETGVTVLVSDVEAEDSLQLARGELAEVAGPAGRDGLRLEARDGAAGLFAVQSGGTDRTLAATRCAAPDTTWWFSAAGGSLAHSSELVLANLDPGPAVVDLQVLGPDGPVEPPGSRAIAVPPGGRVVLPLRELVPRGEDLTVGVTATRGRVVAAVADRFAARFGEDPGSSWLPAQQAPRRSHRIPGLLRGADHTLLVANPGADEALVDLAVSSETGAFTPTGETQLRVPPGEVVVRDLTGLVAEDAGALLVRSSVPVLATVRASTRTDTAHLAAAEALRGPAAATVHPDAEALLTLTAGESGARAMVTSYDETGAALDTATLDLGPGATTRATPAPRAAYLVVRPDRGNVHGTVTWSDGTAVAALPLAELPVTVPQPAVAPAY